MLPQHTQFVQSYNNIDSYIFADLAAGKPSYTAQHAAAAPPARSTQHAAFCMQQDHQHAARSTQYAARSTHWYFSRSLLGSLKGNKSNPTLLTAHHFGNISQLSINAYMYTLYPWWLAGLVLKASVIAVI